MATVDDDDPPLSHRECGECTVCCTALTIDHPELQKLPGHTCTNCVVGQGCAIHATRPSICRAWFCGWRQLDWMDETLRPDQSGVLVYLDGEGLPEGTDIGLKFTILAERGLAAEGLAEALSTAIRGGIATFVNVPASPGFSGAKLLANEVLKEAVNSGQHNAVLSELRAMYANLSSAIETDPPIPIRLTDFSAKDAQE